MRVESDGFNMSCTATEDLGKGPKSQGGVTVVGLGDGVSGNRHLASNPEQQPIGESAFPEIMQKSRCGKSAGPTWSLP